MEDKILVTSAPASSWKNSFGDGWAVERIMRTMTMGRVQMDDELRNISNHDIN